jgi:general secretion pathway protein B
MSYILDALRKSERQRRARQNEPKPAGELLVDMPAPKPTTLSKWLLVVLIVNVIGLAGLLWFVLRPKPLFEQVRPTGADTLAVKPLPKNKAESLPAPKKPSAPKLQPSIADWEAAERTASIPAEPPKSKPDNTAVKKPALTTPSLVEPKPPLTESDESVRAVLPSPQARSIPFLYELPQDFQNSIPPFKINVFVYAANPSERFIMADMAKYRPGQLIKNAVKLKEIRQNSAVVEYNNQIFQIPRP